MLMHTLFPPLKWSFRFGQKSALNACRRVSKDVWTTETTNECKHQRQVENVAGVQSEREHNTIWFLILGGKNPPTNCSPTTDLGFAIRAVPASSHYVAVFQ